MDTDFTPELLTTYVFESEREKELVFAHKAVYDGHQSMEDGTVTLRYRDTMEQVRVAIEDVPMKLLEILNK